MTHVCGTSQMPTPSYHCVMGRFASARALLALCAIDVVVPLAFYKRLFVHGWRGGLSFWAGFVVVTLLTGYLLWITARTMRCAQRRYF